MSLHTSLVTSYRKFQRFIARQKGIIAAKRIANEQSYYPERERKPYNEMLKENKVWARRFGEANEFYTLYGFDVKNGPDQSQYIDYLQFRNTRENANRVGKDDAQVVLLRDKLLFFQYMKMHGLPVPDVFAFLKDGKVFNLSFDEISIDDLKSETDYFLKDQGGECSSYVKHIDGFEKLNTIRHEIIKGSFIMQRKVIQSDEMSVINPHAINTLRIVTINKQGRCYVLSSLLRVGTAKTGNVDNWAAGGLAIGIQPNGYLKKYGFYKPIHGLKESIHPDTGVVFEEFQVPMYKEACEFACKAHKVFFNVRAIGWDIAITKDGPVFIEGNDNFEISLQQACDRPLRKEWLEAVAN
ncbi:MAG: hypothetical protein J1E60_00700 [Christensenellaceae bacterium]|nr:hypothetical protein [Christensenellaceae bacterium]